MFFRLPPNTIPSLKGGSLQWQGELHKQENGSVSLQFNENENLPPVVAANSESRLGFQHVRKFPTIHVVNRKIMNCRCQN
jgi:hypothetical protein